MKTRWIIWMMKLRFSASSKHIRCVAQVGADSVVLFMVSVPKATAAAAAAAHNAVHSLNFILRKVVHTKTRMLVRLC